MSRASDWWEKRPPSLCQDLGDFQWLSFAPKLPCRFGSSPCRNTATCTKHNSSNQLFSCWRHSCIHVSCILCTHLKTKDAVCSLEHFNRVHKNVKHGLNVPQFCIVDVTCRDRVKGAPVCDESQNWVVQPPNELSAEKIRERDTMCAYCKSSRWYSGKSDLNAPSWRLGSWPPSWSAR